MSQEITEKNLFEKITLTFLAPLSFMKVRDGQPDSISLSGLEKERWQVADALEYDRFIKGSAVFEFSEPDSVFWKTAATQEMLTYVTGLFAGKADSNFKTGVNSEIVEWRLIGMKGNIFISRCILEIDCPWDVFLRVFPEIRDPVCSDLKDILAENLEPLKPQKTQLSFPYFHVVISGNLKEKVDMPYLSHSFRSIIYPEDNSPIRSMSPNPLEFIFLGYAFSLVLCSYKPLLRTIQVLPLLEYTSCLYRELALVSSFAQKRIMDQKFKDNVEINAVKNEISIMYYEFVSPTFTYTHEMLVLRDGLLNTWKVKQLLDRAQFLVTQLDIQITEWHKNRENKWAKRINFFLFIITVSTLISVIYDATMLARAFDFLRTAAVEAWENLFIK